MAQTIPKLRLQRGLYPVPHWRAYSGYTEPCDHLTDPLRITEERAQWIGPKARVQDKMERQGNGVREKGGGIDLADSCKNSCGHQ